MSKRATSTERDPLEGTDLDHPEVIGPGEWVVEDPDNVPPLSAANREFFEQVDHEVRWLARCREHVGVTQVELAERLGRSQASVSNQEKPRTLGRREVDTLASYLDALGYDLRLVAVNRGDATELGCIVSPPITR